MENARVKERGRFTSGEKNEGSQAGGLQRTSHSMGHYCADAGVAAIAVAATEGHGLLEPLLAGGAGQLATGQASIRQSKNCGGHLSTLKVKVDCTRSSSAFAGRDAEGGGFVVQLFTQPPWQMPLAVAADDFRVASSPAKTNIK